MWQDKNDTCLIVRQRRRPGEAKQERMRQTKGGRGDEEDARAIRGPSKCKASLRARFPIAEAFGQLAMPTYGHLHAVALNKSPSKHTVRSFRAVVLISMHFYHEKWAARRDQKIYRDIKKIPEEGFFEIYPFRESHVCKLKHIKRDN